MFTPEIETQPSITVAIEPKLLRDILSATDHAHVEKARAVVMSMTKADGDSDNWAFAVEGQYYDDRGQLYLQLTLFSLPLNAEMSKALIEKMSTQITDVSVGKPIRIIIHSGCFD